MVQMGLACDCPGLHLNWLPRLLHMGWNIRTSNHLTPAPVRYQLPFERTQIPGFPEQSGQFRTLLAEAVTRLWVHEDICLQ